MAALSTLFLIYISLMPGISIPALGSKTEQVIFNFAHIPAFGLITFLWFKAVGEKKPRLYSDVLILIGMTILGISVELYQSFLATRTASFLDVGLNLIGIFLSYKIVRSKNSIKQAKKAEI